MATNTRGTNQYYGKYRECCLVAHLNHSSVEYSEPYTFTEEEKLNMYNEMKLVADYLGNHQCEYLGNRTMNESGDIRLDNGEIIELKCVGSNASGTYANFSINYLNKFGFNFHDTLVNSGYLSFLKNTIGDIVPVSLERQSPVEMKDSSLIRHNYPDLYKKIKQEDKKLRKNFAQDVGFYFSNNYSKLYEMVEGTINKDTKNGKKTAPNRIIIFNYDKKIVREIKPSDFLKGDLKIKINELGFTVNDLSFQLSWKNGAGLCNPCFTAIMR